MTRRTLGGVLVAALVASGLLLSVPSLLGPLGRLVLGAPLVLVFPGYVAFRLLFPTRSGSDPERSGRLAAHALYDFRDAPAVVVAGFSVGFSVVLVPVVARVLLAIGAFSRWNLVLTTGAVAVAGAVLALARADPAATADASIGSALHSRLSATRSYLDRDTTLGTLTSVLVVASLVFFLSSVAFALTATPAGEPYTEFYLLTENETGALVANDYPSELSRAEPANLVVGIENHRQETTTYAVVVEIQRLDDAPAIETRELDRFRTRLEPGESDRIDHDVTSPLAGDRLRLQYYLYRGDAPADPTRDSADETLHLNVSGPAG